MQVLQGHTGPVHDARFSSDGRRVVSGGEDGTVRVWRVDGDLSMQRYSMQHSEGVSRVAWSPDGSRLASTSGDGMIHIWDCRARECVRAFDGHADMETRVTWSPDGQRLASTCAGVPRKSGLQRRENLCFRSTVKTSPFAILPGARTGGDWRRREAERLSGYGTRTPGAQLEKFSVAGDGGSCAVTWSRDGRRLAYRSGQYVNVWQVVPEIQLVHETSGTGSAAIAYSPDDEEIAFCRGHDVVLYDLAAEIPRCTLRGHTANVFDIMWHPQGTRMATCGLDGTVRIWDVERGQEIITLAEQADKTSADAWTALFAVAWSPDGQSLASAGADGTVRIWDASKGYQLLQDPTFIAGQTIRQYHKAEELTQQRVSLIVP